MSRALDGQTAAPEDPVWAAALGNSVRAVDTLAGWDALARDAVLLPEGAAPPHCTTSSVARPLRACLGADGGSPNQLNDLTSCCYALNRAFAPAPPSPQADCLCHEAVLSALNGLMRDQVPAAAGGGGRATREARRHAGGGGPRLWTTVLGPAPTSDAPWPRRSVASAR